MLFVDDDRTALDAVNDSFLPAAQNWEATYCFNAAEALQCLAISPSYDVIVVAARPSGMDGVALLERVRKGFPLVIRVVVSDFRDLDTRLRSVSVAHQFLASPLQPAALEEALERCLDLSSRLNDSDLRSVILSIDTLPSPPLTVIALNQALSRADASADDIASILEADAASTAKLLQLVNSAFFGLRHRVTSVHHAVSYLGLATVRNLISAVELVRAFAPSSVELVSAVEGLHQHSLTVAELARGLMGHRRQAHDAFAAGMMHDIGLLAMASTMPEQYVALRAEVTLGNRQMIDSELEIIGATHTELGAYLLSLWGLPHSLVEAVALSHSADEMSEPILTPVHAVFVAEQVVNMIGGSFSSWETPRLPSSEYLAEIGLDATVAELISQAHV